jgi:hypothetical protein
MVVGLLVLLLCCGSGGFVGIATVAAPTGAEDSLERTGGEDEAREDITHAAATIRVVRPRDHRTSRRTTSGPESTRRSSSFQPPLPHTEPAWSGAGIRLRC